RLAPFAIGSLGALSLLAPSASVATSSPTAALAAATPAAAVALADAAPASGAAPRAARDPFAIASARGEPARRQLDFRRLRRDLNVLAGHAATFAGALLPRRAGHLVELQRRARHHRWRTLARAFTGARGRFRLRYAPRRLGQLRLRLLFPGDGAAAAVA